MADYIDRENSVVVYYDSREQAERDLGRSLGFGGEPHQRRNASRVIHGVTDVGGNKRDHRGRELEATDKEIAGYLSSKIHESKKRPGKYFVVYPK